jgi:hypothetical protein
MLMCRMRIYYFSVYNRWPRPGITPAPMQEQAQGPPLHCTDRRGWCTASLSRVAVSGATRSERHLPQCYKRLLAVLIPPPRYTFLAVPPPPHNTVPHTNVIKHSYNYNSLYRSRLPRPGIWYRCRVLHCGFSCTAQIFITRWGYGYSAELVSVGGFGDSPEFTKTPAKTSGVATFSFNFFVSFQMRLYIRCTLLLWQCSVLLVSMAPIRLEWS